MAMESMLTAVELTGHVDEQNRLHLDEPLPIMGARPVKVILLFSAGDEFDEAEWLSATARNPAFDFLNDPAEDIYTLSDGLPFRDKV